LGLLPLLPFTAPCCNSFTYSGLLFFYLLFDKAVVLYIAKNIFVNAFIYG
jgi:hypothetical protein